MNKNFFTWVAGTLLLAASFGTAEAVTIETGKSDIAIATYPDSDEKLYQLSAKAGTEEGSTTYVLTVNKDGNLGLEDVSDYKAKFGESLWCINFGSQGDPKVVDFTNRAHTVQLNVSIDDVVPPTKGSDYESISALLGELNGWTFSSIYKTGIQTNRPLYTSIPNETDSVLALGVGKTDSLVVVKVSLAAIDEAAASTTAYYVNSKDGSEDNNAILLFTLWEPKKITLTADDFNTLLSTADSTARALTFSQTGTFGTNPWNNSSKKLTAVPGALSDEAYAVDGEGKITYTKGTGSTDYLRFTTSPVENPAGFVRVDTAYAQGSEYLDFKIDSLWSYNKTASLTESVISDQYEFKVEYDVANDSLIIQVKEAYITKGGNNSWLDAANSGNKHSLTSSATDLFVKWQATGGNASVITIGGEPIDTKISLGLKCAPSSSPEYTSIAPGVYVIKNAAGQVLGVPIYATGIAASVEWITIGEDVDPNYIPAYQWVVKHIRTNASISPISLTNREYPTIVQSTLQLTEDGAAHAGQLGDTGVKIEIKKSYFSELPDDLKEDPYLGYFYITGEESDYNTYDLNYIHPLSTEYYLGESGSTDSTLIVKNTSPTQFQLVVTSDEPEEYGYPSTLKADGFVRLQKATYTLKQVNYGEEVKVGSDKRYHVKSAGTPITFSVKTTNTTADGKHYYALLDGATNKLNISNELWAYQVQATERTTAIFGISEGTAPVYRKFDKGLYTYGSGEELVEEPFGSPENAPLWLKFIKQNGFGSQYLSEYSEGAPNDTYREDLKNKSISFLGLYQSALYPESDNLKYTFYVDTAYVQRPASETSTKVTLKPQYLLALHADIAYAIEPGEEEEGESYPALTKASYLFNAQDSVDAKNADYAGKSVYGLAGATRLAFVEGVHLGDTLYVLPPALLDSTAAALQTKPELLYATARKIYLGDNDHFDDDKNNKSVVFQFRLIAGDDPNPERLFLIETVGTSSVPNAAQYVNIRNDIPIIGDEVSFTEAVESGQATIFNVQSGEAGKDVSNEKVAATSKVRVLSGAGSISVLNATGKQVTVTNILGQTLTTQVLTSDNARISLPQGIVIVSVKGEPAVKAIVGKK